MMIRVILPEIQLLSLSNFQYAKGGGVRESEFLRLNIYRLNPNQVADRIKCEGVSERVTDRDKSMGSMGL